MNGEDPLRRFLIFGGVVAVIAVSVFFVPLVGVSALFYACMVGLIVTISLQLAERHFIHDPAKLIASSIAQEMPFPQVDFDRNLMSKIIEQLPIGILLIDHDGTVMLENADARMVLGTLYSGRTIVETLRNHELVEVVKSALDGHATQPIIFEAASPRRTVQAVARVMDTGPGAVLLVVQDISNLRRAEQVRRDFVANVSHELRTPVASLKLLIETLLAGALEDPPASRKFLSRIEIEVDRLNQMVHELLELSRIESGALEIRPQPVDIVPAVHSAAHRLADQALRSGITLRVEEHKLPLVQADATRIEQVLVNLIHNSIKFTPPGGEVVVGMNPETVPATATKPAEVTIWVRDTGAGIPSADLPRVFERFFKADRSRASGGTGLGLAICKHTVQSHGGRIWAESTVGEGSTFSFTLPLASSI